MRHDHHLMTRQRVRLGLIVTGLLVALYVIREVWHVGIILSTFQQFNPKIPFVYVYTGQPIMNTHNGILIPRKLHQLWKTTDLSTYPGPEHNTSSKAWKQRYKDWTHHLWTDADVEDLLAREYLWLLPQYRSYTNDIQRADLARLLILHYEGGVYVDLDSYPWDTTFDDYPGMLTYDAVLTLTSNRLVSNHFIMARKHSSFLGFCLHHSHRTMLHLWWLHYLDVFYSTGPLFLHKMLREYTTLADTSQLAVATAAVAVDPPSTPSPAQTQVKRPHLLQTQQRIRETFLILNPVNTNAFVNHRSGRSWMSDGERAVNWLVDRGALGVLLVVGLVIVTVGALVVVIGVIGALPAADRKTKSKTTQHRSHTQHV